MATMAERVTALAGAIRDKINLMVPRLVPPGGLTGQVLRKASDADNSLEWGTPTPIATIAEFLAGTVAKLLTVAAYWGGKVPVALTDATTIAINLSAGINFTVTIAGNRTLALPTNLKVGQAGRIRVQQNGIGGYSLAFARGYRPDDNTTFPTLNSAASAVTVLRYEVTAAGEVTIYGGKPASGGGLREQDYTSMMDSDGAPIWQSYRAGSSAQTVVLSAFDGTWNYRVNGSSTATLASGNSVQIALAANGKLDFVNQYHPSGAKAKQIA